MTKLEKVILALNKSEIGVAPKSGSAPIAMTLSVLIYIGFLLALPATDLKGILWMAVGPAAAAPLLGIPYGRIFTRSLIVLPIILMIGMFNPIIDTQEAMRIGRIGISIGWLSFVGLTLRGLLAMQGVLILMESVGFRGICSALRSMGMPRILVAQILLSYRYLRVLAEEAHAMLQARQSRGFGRKTLPFRMWGEFVGQLYLRSLGRAERIHRAMLARGFSGEIPCLIPNSTRFTAKDIVLPLIALAFSLVVRLLT